MDLLYRAVVIGVAATAALDLWGLLLNRLFGLPMANWGLIGRWFCHLPRATFVHADIGRAAPFANEAAVGWTMHYLIGIAFAAATLILAGPEFRAAPTPFWPLVVGWLTVGFGWFVLQPGLGLGIAASKRANAMQIRALNLIGHTVFGLALFAAAWAIR